MALAYVSSYSADPEAHPAGHPCFMVLQKCSVVFWKLLMHWKQCPSPDKATVQGKVKQNKHNLLH